MLIDSKSNPIFTFHQINVLRRFRFTLDVSCPSAAKIVAIVDLVKAGGNSVSANKEH